MKQQHCENQYMRPFTTQAYMSVLCVFVWTMIKVRDLGDYRQRYRSIDGMGASSPTSILS